MILKSDGAALYDTTDLATLVETGRTVRAGRSDLRGGQAYAGASLCTGFPLRKEDRNRKAGERIWNSLGSVR